jgi:NAD(P)-dependent dehydrogenase (short-subunit alcohol dehydrogenase family)
MGFLEDQANLSGRAAVVVGGASGIGEAVTLALASAGVDIALCDINAAATASTKARVEALGRQALAIVTDATDAASLNGFYVEVGRTCKQVDILVNVVGGVSQRAFLEATAEQCAADIQRNYGYVIQSIRAAVPLIADGGTWAASGFINWPGQGFLPVPLAAVQQRLFGSDPAI